MIRKCINCGSQITSHNPTDFCSTSCDRDYWNSLPDVPFTREKRKTMAVTKEVVVTFTDDLTGDVFEEGAGETVVYSFDGVSYEVDLNAKNATAFRKAFEKYVKVSREKAVRGRKAGSQANPEVAAIREWARAHGYEVNDRGRIPEHIVKAYESKK